MKDLWKQVDSFAAKSKQQWTYADEEIKKIEGWKFKGCPDGIVWRASRKGSSRDVTARTAEELVAKVKAEEGIK